MAAVAARTRGDRVTAASLPGDPRDRTAGFGGTTPTRRSAYDRQVTEVTLTHIGGPTVLIEAAGWRLLTDPTFDAPGGRYTFGFGSAARKQVGPALTLDAAMPVDAVLLSHDQHGDNLDSAGRALLPAARTVLTTVSGARRLGGSAVGLRPWQTTRLEKPGAAPIEVTATPARHGPPLSRPIVGAATGFALRWEGQQHGPLWMTGDTVLFRGLREVSRRLDVGTVLLHLGGVRFPVSGPIRYTLTASHGVELCALLRARTVIPVHYEGWSHFRDGRAAFEQALGGSPDEVRAAVRWLTLGSPTTISV
jgi:L-ascorbate metabolism protein UlaG (beta-lactamase superfamily)